MTSTNEEHIVEDDENWKAQEQTDFWETDRPTDPYLELLRCEGDNNDEDEEDDTNDKNDNDEKDDEDEKDDKDVQVDDNLDQNDFEMFLRSRRKLDCISLQPRFMEILKPRPI